MKHRHGGPAHPEERVLKPRPIIAVSLTLPIEPFIHQLCNLSAEPLAHPAIVRDGVVVEMPCEFQFGLLQECALFATAALLFQPFFHLL